MNIMLMSSLGVISFCTVDISLSLLRTFCAINIYIYTALLEEHPRPPFPCRPFKLFLLLFISGKYLPLLYIFSLLISFRNKLFRHLCWFFPSAPLPQHSSISVFHSTIIFLFLAFSIPSFQYLGSIDIHYYTRIDRSDYTSAYFTSVKTKQNKKKEKQQPLNILIWLINVMLMAQHSFDYTEFTI